MKEILLVGTGGFIGASLRYIISSWFSQFSKFTFPLGTFFINILGCMLIGIFVGLKLDNIFRVSLEKFIAIGLIGGFTTFSTFGLESFELLKAGQYKITVLYMIGSIVIGLIAIGLGIIISYK